MGPAGKLTNIRQGDGSIEEYAGASGKSLGDRRQRRPASWSSSGGACPSPSNPGCRTGTPRSCWRTTQPGSASERFSVPSGVNGGIGSQAPEAAVPLHTAPEMVASAHGSPEAAVPAHILREAVDFADVSSETACSLTPLTKLPTRRCPPTFFAKQWISRMFPPRWRCSLTPLTKLLRGGAPHILREAVDFADVSSKMAVFAHTAHEAPYAVVPAHIPLEAVESADVSSETAVFAHTAHEAPYAAVPAHILHEAVDFADVSSKMAVFAHTAHEAPYAVVPAHIPLEAVDFADVSSKMAVFAHTAHEAPYAAVPAHILREAVDFAEVSSERRCPPPQAS